MFNRPRVRFPSLLAVAGGLIVFASLAFLNLDGYQNEPFGPGDFYGEPPDINWTHGWPYVCMGRLSVDLGPMMLRVTQPKVTSRWPFDDVPATYFYAKWLAADIAIAIAFVVATVCGLTYLARRWPLPRKYGLKFLFFLMTVVAVAIAIWQPDVPSRFVQYRIAIAVLIAAGSIVAVAAASLILNKLHLISSRQSRVHSSKRHRCG